MITTDELKVQLAEHAKAVKDLEEALAIEASRKRVQGEGHRFESYCSHHIWPGSSVG